MILDGGSYINKVGRPPRKAQRPANYNISTTVPMRESRTPIGATGTDTGLNFHVYWLSFPVEFPFADGNSTFVVLSFSFVSPTCFT